VVHEHRTVSRYYVTLYRQNYFEYSTLSLDLLVL
jgi:hypothetical protein